MPELFERMKAAALKDMADKAPVREALADVNTNLREAEGKIYHRFLLIIALAVLFELARRANVEQVSAFGITISSVGELRIGVPVAVAILAHSIICIVSTRRLLQEAYVGLFSALYPELSKSHTAHLTIPLDTAKLYKLMAASDAGSMQKVYNNLVSAIGTGILFLPPLFIIYALVEYAMKAGPSVETVAATVISVAFMAQIPLVFLGTEKVSRFGPRSAPQPEPSAPAKPAPADNPD